MSDLNLAELGNLSDMLQSISGDNKYLVLDLDSIDEDEFQPRVVFDPQKLTDLVNSITERGVKTPISVRRNGERYTINHGARRFRACKLAGLKNIPAIIDDDYCALDQVVENIQRENLQPKEIANFISKQVLTGTPKIEVARLIGKSAAYVSQHIALLNLPEQLDMLYETGKCKDVTVLVEFSKLYKIHPNEVTGWIENAEFLNRRSVVLFKEFVEGAVVEEPSENAKQEEESSQDMGAKEIKSDKRSLKKKKYAELIVNVNGRRGQLLYTKEASVKGKAFVLVDGVEELISYSNLKIVDMVF